MIGYLNGTVRAVAADSVVLETHGVGYEVRVPLGVAAALTAGGPAELWIHTHVREEALALFGFAARADRELFVTLIGLSGIGPKMALAIMSMLTPAQLAGAVAAENAAALTRIPGVGKKTAERLLIDLRDKLRALGIVPDDAAPEPAGADADADRAAAALVSLGFDAARAARAVRDARADLPDAETRVLLTAALRQLQRA
ncbi:MAG TPA: Holliday junction branch migration protein RuvA [bacterium]|nr:Holliday junction branch migration protein RuvA [bacterium]